MSADPKVDAPVADPPAPAAAPATDPAAAPEETKAQEPPAKEASKEAAGAAETEPEAPAKAATPLEQFAADLAGIVEEVGHDEMWGVTLQPGTDHVPTTVVLQKFLRANNSELRLAKEQLTKALAWRKATAPLALLDDVTFDKTKFGELGYVTCHSSASDEASARDVIITWNIYGSVKDNKVTFGNVDEFVKWRAALMELGIQKLKLNDATAVIPDGGEDPYQMIQVHDYKGVSFFRMDPDVKACTKETISTLAMAYPELLSHKYFVNVPAIMGWVFAAIKLFVSPATLRKFHPMASGASLALEVKDIASTLPKEYGGEGPTVKEGLTVKFADVDEAPEEEQPAKTETETKTEAVEPTKPASEDKVDDAAKTAAAEPEAPKVAEPKEPEAASGGAVEESTK